MPEMKHTLFTGVSLSGKTTLARYFSRAFRAKNQLVIVYDKLGTSTLGGDWGDGAEVYENKEDFLVRVYSSELPPCHIFVDEAHDIFGHEHNEHFWMLTEGRHFGMQLYCLTQRPKKLHPDVRTNLHRAFVFRLAIQDMREIGLDYGHDDLVKSELDRGDFLYIESGSAQIKRANVFNLIERESRNA